MVLCCVVTVCVCGILFVHHGGGGDVLALMPWCRQPAAAAEGDDVKLSSQPAGSAPQPAPAQPVMTPPSVTAIHASATLVGQDPAHVPAWDCTAPQRGLSCVENMTVRSGWFDLRQPALEFPVEVPLRLYALPGGETGVPPRFASWAHGLTVECLLVPKSVEGLLFSSNGVDCTDEAVTDYTDALLALARLYEDSVELTTVSASPLGCTLPAAALRGYVDSASHLWTVDAFPHQTHALGVARCFLPSPGRAGETPPPRRPAESPAYSPHDAGRVNDDVKRNAGGPTGETALLARLARELKPLLRVNGHVVVAPYEVQDVWWTPFHNDLPKYAIQTGVGPLRGDPPLLPQWLVTQRDLGSQHVYAFVLPSTSGAARALLEAAQTAGFVTIIHWPVWLSGLNVYYWSQLLGYQEVLYRAARHVGEVPAQEHAPSHLWLLDTDDLFVGSTPETATYTAFLRTHHEKCSYSCGLAWIPYYPECGGKEPGVLHTPPLTGTADPTNPAHAVQHTALDFTPRPYSNYKSVHNLRAVYVVGGHGVQDRDIYTLQPSQFALGDDSFASAHVAHVRRGYTPPQWYLDAVNVTACKSSGPFRSGVSRRSEYEPLPALLLSSPHLRTLVPELYRAAVDSLSGEERGQGLVMTSFGV